MQNLSKIDTAKDLVTKEWVEAQDFLPSSAFTQTGIKNALGISDWALAASKPSYSFSEIGSKPTTLSGYGITDAAKAGFRFDSIQTGDVNIIGWVEAANNWKGQGAGMLVGQQNYYTRINITGENNDPTMYLSRIYAGTAYDWVKVLTEKNVGKHAIEVINTSDYPLPTDTRAFTAFVYERDNWKTAGPALAFPAEGGNKALLNIAIGNGDTKPTRLFLGGVRGGVLQKWVEVLTEEANKFVLNGPVYWGGLDFDSLTTAGTYTLAGGGNTGNPSGKNYGNVMTVVGKNDYFVSQIFIENKGQMWVRARNDSAYNNGSKWSNWRTVLDTENIGNYAMSKAGGTIDGNLTINGEFKTQTTHGHVSLFSNIFEVNASLKVLSGWALYLNGKGIQQWSDLGTYITPISSETTSEKTISPNTFYKWGSVSALSITLRAATNNTHINNYMFEFTASTGFALGGLSGVKWADGVKPNIKAGYTYQFSIINNCATYSAFKTA